MHSYIFPVQTWVWYLYLSVFKLLGRKRDLWNCSFHIQHVSRLLYRNGLAASPQSFLFIMWTHWNCIRVLCTLSLHLHNVLLSMWRLKICSAGSHPPEHHCYFKCHSAVFFYFIVCKVNIFSHINPHLFLAV